MSFPARLIGLLVILAIGAPWATPEIRAAEPSGALIDSAGVTGSPFSPDGDGLSDKAYLDVRFSAAVTVTVTVIAFDDRVVKTLADSRERSAGMSRWAWNGRDHRRRVVADGPYRFRISATGADGVTEVALVGVAKAPHAPYPPAPGAVTVVLNPGHGGPDPGAVYGGIKEEDMVLDTALRLRQMLEATGVRVVMTRAEDRALNEPRTDVNGDGEVDSRDELAARNDVANLARGDVFVTLMDNAYGCVCVRGTETWTHDERSWSAESIALASLIQRAHMRRLERFRNDSWYPIDRGVRFHDFYVVRPYRKRAVPRPSLMPSVLTESLFMDHANELAILAKPAARQAIAVAFFEALTKWLGRRAYGLRYEVTGAPAEGPAGGAADYGVRITNTGNATSSGWVLEARAVPAVPLYDGSGAEGTLLGSARIPDGLGPGASASGMLTGGRIVHHLRDLVDDPAALILFVGYQGQGTLGAHLQAGAREIRLDGATRQVLCQVRSISGFSAHADESELLDWLRHFADAPRRPKRVFLVHGDPEAEEALEPRVRELGLEPYRPAWQEVVELD
jgi:N-acetylmuramoyl-L-alanine amidase